MSEPAQELDYPWTTPPQPGTTCEVAPGVHWLQMPLPFALDHINLWLLEDDAGLVLVDTGLGDESTRRLWQQVLEQFVRGRPVTRVIVTHLHPDHSGNADWLTRRLAAPLWMSEADYLTAHALRERSAGFGIEALLRHLHRHGLAGPRYEAQADRINSRRSPWADFPDCFRRLMDGDQLSIGGRNWQVLVGHGHAPEHVSLYCPALDLLISGDMLLPRISTNISVGPVEPDADPLALFLASLRRLASVVGRDPLVLPSHGPPFRGLHARVAQLEAHHADRLAELEQVCAEPRCAADVIDTLFRRELDVHQTFFAMGEALAHLNHLMHAGRCTRQTGPDGILRFVRSATS